MGKRVAGLFVFRRINSNVEYLMLKPAKPQKNWSPPKGGVFFVLSCVFFLFFVIRISFSLSGRIDNGEDDFAAALRETEEESGYTIDDLNIHADNPLFSNQRTRNGKHKTVIYWLAELVNIEKSPTLSDEHSEYRWLTKDETIAICDVPEFTEIVNHFDGKIRSY